MTDLAEDIRVEDGEEELDELSAEFIDDLVKKLILFTEEFCGIKFFPYQTPIAYAFIESIVLHDGSEKTLIATRQSGKSEVVSNVIASMMVILPRLANIYPVWLDRYAKGFWCGVFAPTEDQADVVFKRVVDRLTSEHALDFLLDPELDDRAASGGSRGKGKIISLKKSGSLCRMQTCNPKAKIEGRTYHFIFIDESQGADEVMITKSIKPMLAFNNGIIVMGGTATRNKCYFYKAIQHNKRMDVANPRGHRQAHFEYDWRIVAKHRPDYGKFIAKEKLTIGEDSDEFQMSYSSPGDTMVLTSDLRYVRLDSVTEGDKLLGFDESVAPRQHRNLRHSEVLVVKNLPLPCYEITLDDGTITTSSSDHNWLVQTAGGRTSWKRTEDLVPTDRIWRVLDKWDPSPPSYAVGYLRAAYDGEGCLEVLDGTRVSQISFAQRDNAMLAEVKAHLDYLGFAWTEYRNPSSGTNGDVVKLMLRGGRPELLRFLGQVRPQRLLDKFAALEGALGSIGRHDQRSSGFEHPQVVGTRFLGDVDCVSIKTSTRTYIAEGLASHNCNRWILEKGMFVSDERLERMYEPSMPLVKQWWQTPVVVGIDVARSTDSTVVTPVWVDWDHPDGFGFYEHRVLNWLEINNVEWESQYFEIIDFLRSYNVLRIGVDAQGVGGAVAERLQILLPHIEVVSVSSDVKTQNDRWTHLTQLIQRDQLVVPGHSKARRTQSWKRFNQQMGELEKIQRGPYMLAAAPDERGAFDDYPDSLAIACAMSALDTLPTVTVSSNPFFS